MRIVATNCIPGIAIPFHAFRYFWQGRNLSPNCHIAFFDSRFIEEKVYMVLGASTGVVGIVYFVNGFVLFF